MAPVMMPMAPIGGFQVARLLGRSTAWKTMVFATSAVILHPSPKEARSAFQPGGPGYSRDTVTNCNYGNYPGYPYYPD